MARDILSLIKEYNANREKEVLPLKYEAMAKDPFRFFRGTCHLFYHDLVKDYPFAASPATWICGDLHLENFGSYKGSNRQVYFDMNDFDEGIKAPLLYDLSRLLVSLEVAIAEVGYTRKEKKKLTQQLLQQYRFALVRNKAFNIEQNTATGFIRKLITTVGDRTRADLLRERTNNKRSNAKLLIDDKLLKLPKEEKKELAASFTKWFSKGVHAGYTVVDAGFRIAGTGSIGQKRYVCLLESQDDPRKKRLIDIKKAQPSSIPLPPQVKQPEWKNEAARIIEVQDMMQHVAPAYLSTFKYRQNWFVVRAIQPTADKIGVDKSWKQPEKVTQYLADLAMLTASAHLRSSGRLGSATADELKEFAGGTTWENPLIKWAEAYAIQVVKDHAEFKEAQQDGFQ